MKIINFHFLPNLDHCTDHERANLMGRWSRLSPKSWGEIW